MLGGWERNECIGKTDGYLGKRYGCLLFRSEMLLLKVHNHEILFYTFFAETESLRSQGPVTREF